MEMKLNSLFLLFTIQHLEHGFKYQDERFFNVRGKKASLKVTQPLFDLTFFQ